MTLQSLTEDAEAQRDLVTSPRSHSKLGLVSLSSLFCSTWPKIQGSPSELCPWHGKGNEMSGGAELCGRMTNGSLVLLGSGFWEPGQQEEPFVHLPVNIAGSDKEQAVDFLAHYWQGLPPGNQHFK